MGLSILFYFFLCIFFFLFSLIAHRLLLFLTQKKMNYLIEKVNNDKNKLKYGIIRLGYGSLRSVSGTTSSHAVQMIGHGVLKTRRPS